MEERYIGIIDGTNKGQLVLTMTEKDGKRKGLVFIHDIKYVQLNAVIEAEIDVGGKTLKGKLSDFRPVVDGSPKEGEIQAEILENGLELKGSWKTDIGTAGSFHVFKRMEERPVNAPPTAYMQKPVTLPPCRLDVSQLGGLLGLMLKDIAPGVEPAFTVNYKGSTFFKSGIEAFVKDNSIPRKLNDLTILVNEHNYSKGYKWISISFKASDNNTLTVTDVDSTWVNGRAREIEDFICQQQSKSSNFFSKHGKDINFLIFLIVLVTLPSIPSLVARILLMASTIILLLGLNKLNSALFPNAIIYLTNREQTFWQKNKDGIIAGVITTVFAGAIIFLAKAFILHWDQFVGLFPFMQ